MNQISERHQSFNIRLCPSIRQQATDLARDGGVSLNYFIGQALTEKMKRLDESARLHGDPAQSNEVRMEECG